MTRVARLSAPDAPAQLAALINVRANDLRYEPAWLTVWDRLRGHRPAFGDCAASSVAMPAFADWVGSSSCAGANSSCISLTQFATKREVEANDKVVVTPALRDVLPTQSAVRCRHLPVE
jgi:hypothetical protein